MFKDFLEKSVDVACLWAPRDEVSTGFPIDNHLFHSRFDFTNPFPKEVELRLLLSYMYREG